MIQEIRTELLKIRLARLKASCEPLSSEEKSLILSTLDECEEVIRRQESLRESLTEHQRELEQKKEHFNRILKSRRWQVGNAAVSLIEKLLGRAPGNLFRPDHITSPLSQAEDIASSGFDPFRYFVEEEDFLPPRVFRNKASRNDGSVALIILNHNGAPLLKQLFDSLLRFNSCNKIEILVGDHGSKDDTRTVLEGFSAKLPVKSYFYGINRSFSFTNNELADQTTAEYLFFVNNDIVFTRDAIPEFLQCFKNNPSAGLVACPLLYPEDHPRYAGKWQHSGMKFRYLKVPPTIFHLQGRKSSSKGKEAPEELHGAILAYSPDQPPDEGETVFPAVAAAAMMCRRDDFIRAGGFDENFVYGTEDVDLSLSFSFKLRKENILLGHFNLIHAESSTRKQTGYYRSLKKAHNHLVLRKRYGLMLKKKYLVDLFCRTKRLTDDIPVALILGDSHAIGKNPATGLELVFMIWILRDLFGWKVSFADEDPGNLKVDSIDLLIEIPPKQSSLQGSKETMIRIGWSLLQGTRGNLPEESYDLTWISGDNGHQDIAGANTLGLHLAEWYAEQYSSFLNNEIVRAFREGRVNLRSLLAELDGGKFAIPERNFDPAQDNILRSITGWITGKFRISIKTGMGEESGSEARFAKDLCNYFRHAGHRTRIDPPDQWYDLGYALKDDLVIVFGGARDYCPQPGHINLLVFMEQADRDRIQGTTYFDRIFLPGELPFTAPESAGTILQDFASGIYSSKT